MGPLSLTVEIQLGAAARSQELTEKRAGMWVWQQGQGQDWQGLWSLVRKASVCKSLRQFCPSSPTATPSAQPGQPALAAEHTNTVHATFLTKQEYC